MKVGGGVLFGIPRAAAFPTGLQDRRLPIVRCFSFSVPDHAYFIKEIAGSEPPKHLNSLVKVLRTRGEEIVSPGAKHGMLPLCIPLSRNSSGSTTALLRWPTAPTWMEMPVVEARNNGVWLLAKSVEHYINRILAEEDIKNSQERNRELFVVLSDSGNELYKQGDFAASQISSLETYLLKKVGLFPDILEDKIKLHLEKGDHVSALVTAEFYTKKEHFPGFGRPFVFNAEVMIKVGRHFEAKDSARGALKSPWWTLGCQYQEVAKIAQWEDEQIEYIKEKVTEAGRQEDIKKGKEPTQVLLDEAAFLLDLASVDGSWDDECLERVAECYKEAGLHQIASFILYRD